MSSSVAWPGAGHHAPGRLGRAGSVALRRGRAGWLWSWLAGVILTCTLCIPSLGAAQDNKAKARALFGEGVAAFDRGDFENALESFTQAYRLAPHPAVRVNMANCYEQLGRYAEATFNYQRFLEESEGNVSPEQRREV